MVSTKERLTNYSLKKVIQYLDSDPDKNMPKALDWVEKFDKEGIYKNGYKIIRRSLSDPEDNWYKYIKSIYSDFDNGLRKKLFENLIINSAIIGNGRHKKMEEKYGCNIPWAILMDPTSACNLHCTGCWAAEYGNRMSMSLETLDSIIEQGKKIGVYMYIYSGGEPLIRKKDIITLCEKHSDCVFLAFTNATLIDEEFANEMLRVKNFVPAMSIEGNEDETDMRRGKGTYKAVIKAMGILKQKKLAFGFSACYHSKNTDTIGSEEFIDDMIAKGCKFGWFFTYMPIGKDAVTDLLATPEQREYMYHQVRAFRKTKPLFMMDFWNDGEFVQGCIAGGRHYLHINANGDVEPCAFIHYSDTNIKEKTLIDALQGPLFMQYRQNQPFNDNHLRPCPLLDNPPRLAEMVENSGAKSTDFVSPEDAKDLCSKCKGASEKWSVNANTLWEKHLLLKQQPNEISFGTQRERVLVKK